jgi:hypothetical protein
MIGLPNSHSLLSDHFETSFSGHQILLPAQRTMKPAWAEEIFAPGHSMKENEQSCVFLQEKA